MTGRRTGYGGKNAVTAYQPRGYQVSNLVKHLTIFSMIPNNAYDDQTNSGRRLKPRGKRRKPFAIECRIQRRVTASLARTLGLQDWWVHSRYTTASRRDQAYAALVKKAQSGWWRPEYRKRND